MPNANNDTGNTIKDSDKSTLHSAGVDLSSTPVEPEGQEEKMVDIDGTTPAEGDADLAKSGLKFVEEKAPPKPNAENGKDRVSTADLEAEFRSELEEFRGPLKPDRDFGVFEKTGSLRTLLVKVQEKLGIKKKSVKSELESLKKMKDSITKDITEIKELEQSEAKINEELGKIESIKKEVEDIEHDLSDNLKT